jgi:predicted nucleotidyltransferase
MYVPKIALTDGEIDLIKKIVSDTCGDIVKVYIFGSRVRGTAKKYSDVDIALTSVEKISRLKIITIRDELESQGFRYLVDLINLNSVSEDFRKVVLETGVEIG